jgi:hypothetical protein
MIVQFFIAQIFLVVQSMIIQFPPLIKQKEISIFGTNVFDHCPKTFCLYLEKKIGRPRVAQLGLWSKG